MLCLRTTIAVAILHPSGAIQTGGRRDPRQTTPDGALAEAFAAYDSFPASGSLATSGRLLAALYTRKGADRHLTAAVRRRQAEAFAAHWAEADRRQGPTGQ